MPWTPLAERFLNLPLILAGPMLRRSEPRAVSVWLALKEPRRVTLRIYARDAGGDLVQQLEGTRHTVRLGDHRRGRGRIPFRRVDRGRKMSLKRKSGRGVPSGGCTRQHAGAGKTRCGRT